MITIAKIQKRRNKRIQTGKMDIFLDVLFPVNN